MLKRAAQQRFAAWLAFAAMALIVLMPAISRSMPTDMDMGGMDMSAMAGMTADNSMAAHHHHPAAPGDPNDPTARCGYCVLLAHNPVTGFSSVLLWTPVELHTLAPQSAIARSAPAVLLLSARPRGPPLRVNG